MNRPRGVPVAGCEYLAGLVEDGSAGDRRRPVLMENRMNIRDRVRRLAARGGLAALLLTAGSRAALAATTGGGSSALPFMGPLQQIETTISGPFAYVITMIGLVMAGGGLIFFGEMSEFMRRLLYVVLAGSLLLGASQVVSMFSGAVI